MVTTIKQTVTVQAGGRVALESPELQEGESAEVVVTVQRPARDVQERLDALHRLQEAMRLTPEAAEKWQADVRAERQAFGPRQE
jgi:hypothetical protein